MVDICVVECDLELLMNVTKWYSMLSIFRERKYWVKIL